MRYILSTNGRKFLGQISWSKVLLAFDFDGTLAPIVKDPESAFMRTKTANLLTELSHLYPCAVISGRSQADVSTRVKGIPLACVVGNHGLEPWHVSKALPKKIIGWKEVLDRRFRSFQGVFVENKAYSLAIHYRLAREKKKIREEIFRVLESFDDVRLIGGKQVVNVLPKDAPHKGLAVERIRTQLGCDTAVYVGDDKTDEDVFSMDQPGQLVSVRVGKKSTSSAAFYLRGQREIDSFLELFVRCRKSREHLERY